MDGTPKGQRVETGTPQSRIAVFLQQRESSDWEVVVRLEAWDAVLGWYPQKTLTLAPGEVGHLRRLLAAADAQLQDLTAPPESEADTAEVRLIPFPHIRQLP
ncbi:MAG: hypothetical protein HY689_03525 [Chloroflexi bacterium]|nr:hypothetical protein [Chloroflexota bacterium]